MQSKKRMRLFVTGLLKNNLPTYYYYHNTEHTLYVADRAAEIGRQEKCNEKEIDLLIIAALWHDTGFIKTYTGHEEAGCELAHHYLSEFGCLAEDIQRVCGMIMATKIPQSPNNKLEEIIADADLEYLGTETVAMKAYNLFRELQHLNPLLTEEEWNGVQISFLQKHHYFTRFCKENREPLKLMYLKKLVNDTR